MREPSSAEQVWQLAPCGLGKRCRKLLLREVCCKPYEAVILAGHDGKRRSQSRSCSDELFTKLFTKLLTKLFTKLSTKLFTKFSDGQRAEWPDRSAEA